MTTAHSRSAIRRVATLLTLSTTATLAGAAEPDPPVGDPQPVELRPIDFEDLEGLDGFPAEIQQQILRDLAGLRDPDEAETAEGMEDAARYVLERCFDATTRAEVSEIVDEAYWDYYDRYSEFGADPMIEGMIIRALLGDPAFGRHSIARAGAVDLLVLCDDYSNDTAAKFPTGLVTLLTDEFELREDEEIDSMIFTFARRLEPADKLLWYPIPAQRLRSDDAQVVWRSFDLFEAIGVLGARDEAYLQSIIANPRENAPELWAQLDEPLAIRRDLAYTRWDRTLFRAEAVATLLALTRDPDGAVRFLNSLTGRARIDAARGIVDALWAHADHDFDASQSPFGSEKWTEHHFARIFDVLDATLLDPRASLIVGTDFSESEWGGRAGEWYYDSVVGDLVDLYDSPFAVVAQRSVEIARLAAAMHGGPEALAAVDKWLEENTSADWNDLIVDPDDLMGR